MGNIPLSACILTLLLYGLVFAQQAAEISSNGVERVARKTAVICLKKAVASDVKRALDDFAITLGGVTKPYLSRITFHEYRRNVEISVDDNSDSLTVSATSSYFDDVVRLVGELDQFAPRIFVQALFVERFKSDNSFEILSRRCLEFSAGDSKSICIGDPPIIGHHVIPKSAFENPLDPIRKNWPKFAVDLQLTPKRLPNEQLQIDTRLKVVPNKARFVSGGIDLVESTLLAFDGTAVALPPVAVVEQVIVERKTPWFGDHPGVGLAFRKQGRVESKSEIVVILSPHTISNRDDARRISADEAIRTLRLSQNPHDCTADPYYRLILK